MTTEGSRKKTLFLTGGSGMVGRNILEHPAIDNWRVLAPSSSELNLENAADVDSYIALHNPDLIVHAAGKVGGIQANIADPVSFLIKNSEMGINIVMAACRHNVCNLLNLASTCMYPKSAPSPLVEELILTGELEPTNEAYALAKIVTMRLCQYVNRTYPHLNYKTIIPCNIYGRHDTFDPKKAHLVPSIIKKIHDAKVKGDSTVLIWGDGEARREFMYAGDLADAIMRAAVVFETLPETMNCGMGTDLTVAKYYEIVAEVIGWHGSFEFDLTKPVGMKQKLSDVSRQLLWGWSPETNIHSGVKTTYQYFLKELNA